MLAETALLC